MFEAFQAGYDAGLAGGENPFPPRSADWYEWNCGYETRRDEIAQ